MSREILFRGKRTDNGEWVEGYFIKGEWYLDEKEIYALLPLDLCFFPCCEISKWILVDPETVCQYIGMTDKNGRKIFEGDIVKTSQYGVEDGNGHNYAGFDTFSVEFSDGSFCLMNKWRRFNLRPLRDFEVCGNIFDNFELLEGA